MIVDTRESADPGFIDSEFPVALEHEKIQFVSYPYEWSYEMLKDAALLTLDITVEALKHGFILRDGSSFNIQFLRGRPVFIDILSFAPYKKGRIWMGYSQFCRMFLFPLMLASHKNVDYRPWLRGSLEGISLQDIAGIFTWRDFYKRGVLFQVLLQDYFHKKGSGAAAGGSSSLNVEKLGAVIGQLKNTVRSLKNPYKKTVWTNYYEDHGYGEKERSIKAEFVEKVCGERKRPLVWDIGSNTGEYSIIAERNADLVLALDSDISVIDRLYRTVGSDGKKRILPLYVDVADPSPNCGWMNRETKRLEERGRPDLVIALALIHHLCIARNITLDSFVEWITGLGSEGIIEFVSKEDEMVKEMLKTREDIFDMYSKTEFEALLSQKAAICDTVEVSPGKRYLYHYRVK